jgi:hypothetical protein
LICAERGEVVWLEVGGLPCIVCEQFNSQVGVFYWYLLRVLGPLCDGVCDDLCNSDKLLLLQLRKEFGIVEGLGVFDTLEEFPVEIFRLFGLQKNDVATVLLDPLVLETIALSYTCSFLSEDVLYLLLVAHQQTI